MKVPHPRILKNFAIRTLGNKNLSAPKEAWRQLDRKPYKNALFTVRYDSIDNELEFRTNPERSAHLMFGLKYAKDSVKLKTHLIREGDNLVLHGDSNIPTRWLDMLYEYKLLVDSTETDRDGFKYNLYDQVSVELESTQDDEFHELCNDTYFAKNIRSSINSYEPEATEKLDEMNEKYGQRFNDFTDESYNKYFHDVSVRSDDVTVNVVTGPEVPTNHFSSEETERRSSCYRIVQPLKFWQKITDQNVWEMHDQNASTSSKYFTEMCQTAPNDFKQYGCDVATSGGGIRFPNSSYHLASLMTRSYMRGPNHIQFHNDLDMSNNYFPTGSITNEDLVVLAEDVNKVGGVAKVEQSYRNNFHMCL